ncbi:MAG: hypothetical protein Ct9H300mP19_10340 [Dehalococcoidia bacterium]|nr:MAG: hypothetical protein Ct9H300mP19_10340 [Dehalococcoidia bacterium]
MFDPPDIDSQIPVHAEFKVGEMSLKHDAESDVFTIVAKMKILMMGLEWTSPFSFKRSQAEEISERSINVVAAGRKPCPLCTAPLDPRTGHFCVKVNG